MNINISISNDLYTLAKAFALKNSTLYIVGGYVRNSILGLPMSDIDIAGDLRAEEMEKLSRHLGFRSQVVNEKLGTVLISGEHEQYEYTCFRVENYRKENGEHSPSDVSFTDDIRLDASRRDFTINAIYYDILGNKVLDFYGGLNDLNKSLLRQIKNDTLSADGLRLLRLVRFSSELNYKIERNTFKSAIILGDRLKDISKERFNNEFRKIAVADLTYGVYGASPLVALDEITKLGLWKYVFDFDIDFKMNRKMCHKITKVKRPTRYLYLLLIVMYSSIGRFATTRANIDYVANQYIGGGLKESKTMVARLKDLYLFLSTVHSDFHTYKCAVAYSKFDDEEVDIVKVLLPKVYDKMEKAVVEMKAKAIPFGVHDLDITPNEIIALGVKQTSISLVLQRLVNLCLDERIINKKDSLISAINDSSLV